MSSCSKAFVSIVAAAFYTGQLKGPRACQLSSARGQWDCSADAEQSVALAERGFG
jgi:hypothetical protein